MPDTNGYDLLVAVRDRAAEEATRLETEAVKLAEEAAKLRQKALALRMLHETATRMGDR